MMQLQDMDVEFELEDCQFALRALENEAYSAIISALRARGPLNQYIRLILEHLRLILNVSFERHKAEVRRALADPLLLKMAQGQNPQMDITFEWVEEAKRVFGGGNYASSVFLDTPSAYRFNFLRSSKNDSLLQLADSLAYLAVEHNRSKLLESGDSKFFEALKKPGRPVGSTKKVDFQPPFAKNTADSLPLSVIAQPAPTTPQPPREKQITSSSRKRAVQKHEAASSSSIVTNIQSKPTSGGSRKGAGRPRKIATDVPAKQRFGQLIAARSASAMRRQVTTSIKDRGPTGQRFTTISTSSPTSPSKSGSSIQIGRPGHVRPMLAPMIPFFPRATTPVRQPAPVPSRPLSTQPPVGPKMSPTQPVQPKPTLISGKAAWSFEPKPSHTTGNRVPVGPLSLMVPMSRSTPTGSTLRYHSGPSSPTRPPLSGEAPGVYADDYNANSVDSMDQEGPSKPSSSSDPQVQPQHFMSSLSATYYAQNTSPPVKIRRSSPMVSSTGHSVVATLAGQSSRITGISVKSKSKGAAASWDVNGAAKMTTATTAGSLNLPAQGLDQTAGQKLIVLPSTVIRRAQQPPGNSDQSGDPGTSRVISQSQPSGKQSLIIVRRAASSPLVPAVVSTTTTPTKPSPSPETVKSNESQDEVK